MPCSLAKLNVLEEYGITLEDVIPHAFKIYNENCIMSMEERGKLCWAHMPPETFCNSENDFYYFDIPGMSYRDNKRENFISNSEKIEKSFALLITDIIKMFSGHFYSLTQNNAVDVALFRMDEVTTCIRFWKQNDVIPRGRR